MKKFLCVGEPYELNGEKKMRWNRIGEIFTAKSGKDYAKLYTMPGTLLSIFEDKPKEDKPASDIGDMEVPF
jgi:hypothetical protein